jgi:hypothetical protein
LEAIQNASNHGGQPVQVSITLRENADELSFEVSDDGRGLDPSEAHAGTGLQNMRDRLGALDGHLAIATAPGRGTVVSGSVHIRDGENTRRPRVSRVPEEGRQTTRRAGLTTSPPCHRGRRRWPLQRSSSARVERSCLRRYAAAPTEGRSGSSSSEINTTMAPGSVSAR